ncbi:MAG: SCP2 sterol-binding domain-containing protein [Nitrososphaerota archaeon]|nr:SCP2 sterol-binding domain-containing protein [Candidatus Geocrenenecus dongiae]
MDLELLREVERIVNIVNSDYAIKKNLPRESITVELKVEEDESIFIEVSEEGLRILEEFKEQPDSKIIAKKDVLIKMLRGELDPVKAFFLGKVKVEGSIDLAYILQSRMKDYQKILRK